MKKSKSFIRKSLLALLIFVTGKKLVNIVTKNIKNRSVHDDKKE